MKTKRNLTHLMALLTVPLFTALACMACGGDDNDEDDGGHSSSGELQALIKGELSGKLVYRGEMMDKIWLACDNNDRLYALSFGNDNEWSFTLDANDASVSVLSYSPYTVSGRTLTGTDRNGKSVTMEFTDPMEERTYFNFNATVNGQPLQFRIQYGSISVNNGTQSRPNYPVSDITSYRIMNTSIATVDASGTVNATGLGRTVMLINSASMGPLFMVLTVQLYAPFPEEDYIGYIGGDISNVTLGAREGDDYHRKYAPYGSGDDRQRKVNTVYFSAKDAITADRQSIFKKVYSVKVEMVADAIPEETLTDYFKAKYTLVSEYDGGYYHSYLYNYYKQGVGNIEIVHVSQTTKQEGRNGATTTGLVNTITYTLKD